MTKKLLILLFILLNMNVLYAKGTSEAQVLILIHTENGGTYELAKSVAAGAREISGVNVSIKQVPSLTGKVPTQTADIPIATIHELSSYDAIAFGSPVYFGGVSSSMKYFLENSIDMWTNHELEGIPATVFMSAGSGAGRELAIQSLWSMLSVHGMILVSNGIMGTESLDKSIPQGNTVLGITSLTSMPPAKRPSDSEKEIARLQGASIAKQALAHQYLKQLYGTNAKTNVSSVTENVKTSQTDLRLKQLGISIPDVPNPVGSYLPYKRSGNLIYINQVALKNGKIVAPGIVGKDITEDQAREAVKQTMLNVIAVLKNATNGNLDRVKQAVQLTGIFNTEAGYTKHADLMNTASKLVADIFADKGVHARATFGASSLPENSPVEIQAIFEIE